MANSFSCDTVLIIDDEQDVARLTKRQISQIDSSLNCVIASCADEALELTTKHRPGAAIVDLSLDPTIGPQSGLSLINALLQADQTLRIIVLTGHSSIEFGIRALQQGAASFLAKPVESNHLYSLLKDCLATSALKRNYERTIQQQQDFGTIPGIIANSPSMNRVIESIYYAAENNLPLLILGETGVGKGLIARAVHRLSERRTRQFVRVQPSFSNLEMLSSELFGHEKGAFTGAITERKGLIEEADRGTLFIDEIGELSHDTQIMLLETLQEKSYRRIGSNKNRAVDFRLISATNITLEQLKGHSRLRSDFFHRIAHIKIEVPALRERREDILPLANFFAEQIQTRDCLAIDNFSQDAQSRLLQYGWPGNVRELQAVVESACHRANFKKSRIVEEAHIELINEQMNQQLAGDSFRERIQKFEESIINEALEAFNGNQTKAAASLGMDRTSFRRILNRRRQSQP